MIESQVGLQSITAPTPASLAMSQADKDAVFSTEVMTVIFGNLSVHDLGILASVGDLFRSVSDSPVLWESLCQKCWAQKVQRFHLTPERRASLLASGTTWKEHYKIHLQDGRRERITSEELSSLVFDFTFVASPETTVGWNYRFAPNGYVENHPQMLTYEWRVLNDGRNVMLGPYPMARVHRRSDWGWIVSNVNIICCSIDEADEEEHKQVRQRGSAATWPRGRNAHERHAEFFPIWQRRVEDTDQYLQDTDPSSDSDTP